MTSTPEKKELSFFETVKLRTSIRKFKPDPIPEEDIRRMIEAASLAPCAGNQQPWRFLVVRDREKLMELKKVTIEEQVRMYSEMVDGDEEKVADFHKYLVNHIEGMMEAPIGIAVFTDSNSKHPEYNHFDGTLAAGNLILAARALGYGTVFLTDTVCEPAVQKVFGLPDNLRMICYTPVGIPVNWPTPLKKVDIESLLL
jgi:nitroreductase